MPTPRRIATATAGLGLATAAFTGAFGVAGAFAANNGENCPNPAGHYPPGQCSKALGLSAQALAPGQQFGVNGTDFKPGSSASLDLHTATYHLGTFTANSSGVIDAAATVPTGVANGRHTVTLTGVDAQGRSLVESASITVSSGHTSSSASGLPFTGADAVGPLTGAGVGMVVAGGLTLMAIRRRRRPQAA